jgi:hypothetical protein
MIRSPEGSLSPTAGAGDWTGAFRDDLEDSIVLNPYAAFSLVTAAKLLE